MFEKAGLLFMYALTPLHPGSGASVATVDLPIQRERHTRFPMMQASGVKGGLRSLATSLGKRRMLPDNWEEQIRDVFGPDTRDAPEHGGALAVTDARLCLFPVRSVSGLFAWVTCPAVIARLARDLELVATTRDENAAAEALKLPKGLPSLDRRRLEACAPDTSSVVVVEDTIVLEDLCFTLKKDGRAEIAAVAQWFADHAFPSGLDFWKKKVKSDLVLIGDEDFRYLVETCTEVITRVKLGEAGTVEAGPWDEEHVPADSLLYTVTLATKPKATPGPGAIADAQGVLDFLKTSLAAQAPVTQFGGDETVGRGLVKMRFLDGTIEGGC